MYNLKKKFNSIYKNIKKNKILKNKQNKFDLFNENLTRSLKEIKENLNKWKDIPCSETRRLNVIKMAILLKLIYRFDTIPIKIPAGFFAEIYQFIITFIWKCKEPREAKKKKKSWKTEQSWRTHTAQFELYNKVRAIKTVWDMYLWHKGRHIGQWNRIQSPEIKLLFSR